MVGDARKPRHSCRENPVNAGPAPLFRKTPGDEEILANGGADVAQRLGFALPPGSASLQGRTADRAAFLGLLHHNLESHGASSGARDTEAHLDAKEQPLLQHLLQFPAALLERGAARPDAAEAGDRAVIGAGTVDYLVSGSLQRDLQVGVDHGLRLSRLSAAVNGMGALFPA